MHFPSKGFGGFFSLCREIWVYLSGSWHSPLTEEKKKGELGEREKGGLKEGGKRVLGA